MCAGATARASAHLQHKTTARRERERVVFVFDGVECSVVVVRHVVCVCVFVGWRVEQTVCGRDAAGWWLRGVAPHKRLEVLMLTSAPHIRSRLAPPFKSLPVAVMYIPTRSTQHYWQTNRWRCGSGVLLLLLLPARPWSSQWWWCLVSRWLTHRQHCALCVCPCSRPAFHIKFQ